MEDVVGSNTSCYVGSFTKDYSEMLAAGQAEEIPLYYGIGTGTAILSNRISWFFDLRGPSISIDTACSSSLVALHLGCQSLRTGESTMVSQGKSNEALTWTDSENIVYCWRREYYSGTGCDVGNDFFAFPKS